MSIPELWSSLDSVTQLKVLERRELGWLGPWPPAPEPQEQTPPRQRLLLGQNATEISDCPEEHTAPGP